MSPELEVLWALRGLDEQASGLRAELGRFPAQRGELQTRTASERRSVDELKAAIGEVQKRRRDRERDIEAAREQERKFQTQLYAVKKNEEYTALQHEIDGMKAKRSDLETEVLLQLEEEERLLKEKPQHEQALAKAEREAAERGAELDREEGVLRERMAGIEAERSRHLEHLGAAVRARYERIHGSLDGRAVVPILKGACGGCYRGQPPQVLQEARRGDRLLTCDGCGRLMVWPPEG